MQFFNRMIEGAKNLLGGGNSEASISVTCIELQQPAQRPGWSQPYATRDQALAAAKAEINAKIEQAD